MKIPNLVVYLLLLPLWFSDGFAQQAVPGYEPVNFPDDQSEIVSRIKFPDSPEDLVVLVFCDVKVTEAGDFEQSVCWSEHEKKVRFTRAVEKNIDVTQLDPARVDGSKVEVYFQYSVLFEKYGDIKSIKLFPHQFVGIRGPGDGYTGPQRYVTPVVTLGLLSKCRGSFLIQYHMIIPAEGGKPENVEAMNKSDNHNCERYTQTVAELGRYIPAFLHGVATKAPYRETWADRAWR